MLSASLLCLSKAHPSQSSGTLTSTATRNNDVIFDDMELPKLRTAKASAGDKFSTSADTHDTLLEFTRTAGKANKQLPLLGMPDKAFYHIH